MNEVENISKTSETSGTIWEIVIQKRLLAKYKNHAYTFIITCLYLIPNEPTRFHLYK